MSVFLKSLQQPEYVHVLLNHLPITGLGVALLSLVVGLVVRKRPVLLLGLALVSLLALSAWPVAEYGERGYDRVLSMSDDDGQVYLERHRDLAERWMFLFYVTATAGAVAMVVGWKWPWSLWPASLGVALLCLGSLVAATFIAESGGVVRHREFRFGPPLQGPSSWLRLSPAGSVSSLGRLFRGIQKPSYQPARPGGGIEGSDAEKRA